MDVASPPELFAEGFRAHVAAADPVVRRALSSSLRAGAERVDVSVGPSLLDLTRDVDLALWDLGADALAVIERLGATPLPTMPVVALIPTAEHVRAALSWGARAALPRDVDDDALATSLRSVMRGLVVVAQPFVEALLAAEERRDSPSLASAGEALTAREREVLGHVAEGLSNKLIANKLGISEHTVKFHVNAVMARLGAQSRTDAVVRAARRGLLVL